MSAYRSFSLKKPNRPRVQNEPVPAWVEFDNVTVAYNGTPALTDVTFRVPAGARLAVIGPNGAGKSTLFKALVGLLPVRSGRILIHGQPLGSYHECVAYVPQREEVDWRFPLTVEDLVMMGRFGKLGWLKKPGRGDREIVQNSLEQMGITDLAHKSIDELSGGQQQRAFLARAIAQEPHILLMDEPFTGVDISTQEAVLQFLDGLHAQGVTIMVSTHDLSLAARSFETVLLIKKNLLAYGPPEQALNSQSLSRAFGGQVYRLPDGSAVVDECCPADVEPHNAQHYHGGGA